MFPRKEVMSVLAEKNVAAFELKKEQKLLTNLQERTATIKQEQEKLKKEIEANNKRVVQYCARIKNQYMKLEVKEEEPAEGYEKWAAASSMLNVQNYHKELKQLKEENEDHERKIIILQNTHSHFSAQTASKKIEVENLQQELVEKNKSLKVIYPSRKHTLNEEKANSIVKTAKGSLNEIREEREKKSSFRKS